MKNSAAFFSVLPKHGATVDKVVCPLGEFIPRKMHKSIKKKYRSIVFPVTELCVLTAGSAPLGL